MDIKISYKQTTYSTCMHIHAAIIMSNALNSVHIKHETASITLYSVHIYTLLNWTTIVNRILIKAQLQNKHQCPPHHHPPPIKKVNRKWFGRRM